MIMMKSKIIDWLQVHPVAKQRIYNWMMQPVKCRPRRWMKCFSFLYIKKGNKAVIYRSVRKDITPFHPFILGNYSVIEDYCCVNNAVGEIRIGDHTRIGLHNTLIGPVRIGNNVNLAQGVVISGLNHNYKDTTRIISEQGVCTSLIIIEDNVWIGANTVITAGVSIGKHCVIGAGSVVTKDIPRYSCVAGNPARIIKRYNFEKKEWERL